MNNDQRIIELFSSIKAFIKEKELEFGASTTGTIIEGGCDETLTESELIDVFGISRTTLYRARRSGDLPFLTTANGGIEYNYSAVMLALKSNRFKVPSTSKIDAIEKLKEYRNIKMLSYEDSI